ncbi:hypothetical protein HMF8227_02330 [Saliniradius amylolyticus]|uniref:Methyltransferase small domain-containing protein n=1 Tax=Saliniradius amylolyticus TaxID=2183582 RepID=A0A2S2E5H5_9ALTE|nr:hypothetical protein [Saliniradius amylolyticus]AWL12782.1 hypothetical protein HMF8227_02330 [Saliniradius amylolyticus]
MASANSRRNPDALPSDLYTTPEWAVKALLKRERFEGSIIDPGCGYGTISEALKAKGHQDVTSLDLNDWGYGETGVNYLEHERQYANVIMNPPFLLLSEFITHAMEHSQHKVAVFARINALEGVERFDTLYANRKPRSVYVFVNRVKCPKAGVCDGESSSVFYCWLVWDWRKPSPRWSRLKWLADKPPKQQRPRRK